MFPALASPRATLRLQFHRGFTLDDAMRQVPYFATLGISHIYASPLTTARSGSTHGYDVVDCTRINPELGGEAALWRLVEALRQHQMGLVLDIVPNHMSASVENLWWTDVLTWGPASAYAHFFDIDWHSAEAGLNGKVLAPFLGKTYGQSLAQGELILLFNMGQGHFVLQTPGGLWPIAPQTYSTILAGDGPVFEGIAALFTSLCQSPAHNGTSNDIGAAHGLKKHMTMAHQTLAALAQTAQGKAAIDTLLQRYSCATPEGRAQLHALLEQQHYRLTWWRNAADQINWRRFFEINELIGMRVEDPAVFEATHALIARLYAEGAIDGVRVDHIDGLADPRIYGQRLRALLEAANAQRPENLQQSHPYIVVEKILADGEVLPGDWGVDGTTGYDFMNEVAAVLHDADNAEVLQALWSNLREDRQAQGRNIGHKVRHKVSHNTGRSDHDFDDELRQARRQIIGAHLAAEFDALALILHRLAQGAASTRDLTLAAIKRGLQALLIHFRVYRIYPPASSDAGLALQDQAAFAVALQAAQATLAPADAHVLEHLDRWLGYGDTSQLANHQSAKTADETRTDATRLATARQRFQQLTPPLAAKAGEDTAFYRYGRLLSRNEVGSDPSVLGISVADFHAVCQRRAAQFPQALLATATHDHKRGEDLRMRLAVLSEIPARWSETLLRWMVANAGLKTVAGIPSAAEEAMLYQMLIGIWPGHLSSEALQTEQGRAALCDLQQRLAQWQQKALREAKQHSSWAMPDEAYENASADFLAALFDTQRCGNFLNELAELVAHIEAAGIVNSLAQTVLRLTVPGVPDLYQGCEFWDFSLVDPDNRRPVDYAMRQAALRTHLAPFATGNGSSNRLALLLDQWRNEQHSGHIKQALIQRLLGLRARWPELFRAGSYEPLNVEGSHADQVIAFMRQHGSQRLVVIVPRLIHAALGNSALPFIPSDYWGETRVLLPTAALDNEARDPVCADAEISQGPCAFHDICSERSITISYGSISVSEMLADLPVAILHCNAT